MTLALCLLLFVGTAAALWLISEWQATPRIRREEYTIRDMWEGWRK